MALSLAMRARLVLTAVPLALLLAGCGGSTGTGTETRPSLDGQAPNFEVVSETPDDDGLDLTVAVDDLPTSEGVSALVAELREQYTDDGVYDMDVVCQGTEEGLAEATWAVGDAALASTGLAEGEVDSEVDGDAVCEPG